MSPMLGANSLLRLVVVLCQLVILLELAKSIGIINCVVTRFSTTNKDESLQLI